MKITDEIEGIFPCAAEPEEISEDSVIHTFPQLGMGVTPCCNKQPLDFPAKDRMTVNLSLATCPNPIGEQEDEGIEEDADQEGEQG